MSCVWRVSSDITCRVLFYCTLPSPPQRTLGDYTTTFCRRAVSCYLSAPPPFRRARVVFVAAIWGTLLSVALVSHTHTKPKKHANPTTHVTCIGNLCDSEENIKAEESARAQCYKSAIRETRDTREANALCATRTRETCRVYYNYCVAYIKQMFT